MLVDMGGVILAQDTPQQGTILWNNHVDSGSFEEWHFNTDESQVQFNLVHEYGCPPDYSNLNHTQNDVGNGQLIDIVSATGAGSFDTGPTCRTTGRDLIVRHTSHNSVDAAATGVEHPLYPGSPPYDEQWLDHYDAASGSPPTVNTIQRVSLADTRLTADLAQTIPILPSGTERWISISFYLDANFPFIQQTNGFMTIFGIKGTPGAPYGAYDAPVRPWLGILLGNDSWIIRETWMADSMYPSPTNQDYRYAYYYDRDGCNTSQLDSTYVGDGVAAKAMLGTLNKGGWTDFIFNYKDDTTEPASSNTGFCDVYMRQGAGSWLKVLEMRPKQFTFDSQVIEKGIGLSGAGYTAIEHGIYCSYYRVWGAANSAVLYWDNNKIGDENVTFKQMTPDNSNYTG
jgi:hypothetical protein